MQPLGASLSEKRSSCWKEGGQLALCASEETCVMALEKDLLKFLSSVRLVLKGACWSGDAWAMRPRTLTGAGVRGQGLGQGMPGS